MQFARFSVVFAMASALAAPPASISSAANGDPVWGGELRFALHSEPKTWDPLMTAEDASGTIRLLTHASLVRMNRQTQKYEPDLAESWRVTGNGKKIVFQLRAGVTFSDGTPLTADDVVFTLRRAMNPELHAPIGDALIAVGVGLVIETPGQGRVSLTFPGPIANPVGLLEGLPILSSKSPLKDKAVLGPFELAEYKAGAYILLKRNSRYWKMGPGGRRLPFLDSIRLDIQSNREIELQRFRRGEIHLMESIDAESFARIASEMGSQAALDLGPAFENEMLWFNMKPDAPIADYKKAWFQSRNFRRAIAESIRLDDIVKLVYQGRATAAAGILSRANQFWLKQGLEPHPFDLGAARKRLALDGFNVAGGGLTDRAGHAVEFSVVTSSGGKVRGRIAAMLQDDLGKIGVKLNIVTLDFPSLLERIGRTANYETALLGLVGEDIDPNSDANVWLSHAPQHMWNPNQKQPVTPWEAEIDKLIAAQAASADQKKRKLAFDRVQQIIWDEAPVIHLVNRNALVAVSPRLRNVQAGVMNPHLVWNAESLYLAPPEKKP